MMGIFSGDPMLRSMQLGLLAAGSVIVFLLLFATRDILLRTHSFLYQIACILLVAFLPGIGFLLYLLIRPARTIKEREMEAMVRGIAEMFALSSEETEATEETDETDESEEDSALSPTL